MVSSSSCKKAKGPANGNSVQPNNNLDSTVALTATINGVTWPADSVFGYFINNSGNDSGKIGLEIIATRQLNNVTTSMIFFISNYTGPNTYVINPPVNTATYYVGNMRNYAITGQINVTSDTAYALRGTFNFIAGADTVTNGVFDVAQP